MKYALLFAGDESRINAVPTVGTTAMSEEYAAYHQALVKAGVYVGGERLRATADATTVRVRDKKAVVLSGPYAETQEQLGGFVIIDVPDLDRAIEWAEKCPLARTGSIEIRPIWSAAS
jgi:hypothetical protein